MDAGKGGINECKKLDICLLADAKIRPRVHLPDYRSAHLHCTRMFCDRTVALSFRGATFFRERSGFRAEGIANNEFRIHTHDRVLQARERTGTISWWVHALDVQSN